jgi:hypothetical protein
MGDAEPTFVSLGRPDTLLGYILLSRRLSKTVIPG